MSVSVPAAVHRAILVLALVWIFASPALAQTPAPDPAESARIRLGNFAFTPAVWMTGGYDSNVTREPGSIGDYELVTVPQVEYWLRVGPTLFSGAAAVEFMNYRVQVPTFTVNHAANIAFTVPDAVLKPRVSYAHRNLFARPTGYEIGERSRRIEDDAVAGLYWNVGSRTTLTAEGRLLKLNWDAAAEYQGSNLRESLNRTSTAATAGISTELTPLTRVSGMVQFIADRFEFSPERDGDSFQVLAGLEMTDAALVSGSALVGYRHFESPESGALNFDGVVAAVNLAYVRETRTQLLFAVDRAPSFSYSEDQGYYLLTSLGARYDQALGQDWAASAFGALSWLDYSITGLPGAVGANKKRTDFGGGLSRRIGEFTRVGMDVTRVISRGKSPWDAWRAVAFFVYGTDRLQRLDRPLPDDR